MTRALLSLQAGAFALAVTYVLLRAMIPTAPLRRANYRGIPVAAGMGVVLLTGIVAGTAIVGALFALSSSSRLLGASSVTAVPLVALALGFGLLGLFDDLSTAPERGFRGHLGAARTGRATSGALKLFAGAAIALTVAAPESTNLGWLLVHGAIVALAANLFNGLDLRPGRAAKFFLLAVAPLAVAAPKAGSATLAAALGATVAFLPDDLRERAMLGDAGANALGAIAGGAIVYAEPAAWVRLAVLGLLVVLTIAAERPGLSRVIAALPPLRGFDRIGRVPETQTPETRSGDDRPGLATR
jgi:hypothetical protein